MTKEQWNDMSRKHRLQYLDQSDVKFEKRTVMDTRKKVGDYSAITTQYRALRGGVVMSAWKPSKIAADMEANKVLFNMKQALVLSEDENE